MAEMGQWSQTWFIPDEAATEALGEALAEAARGGGLVFLRGDLGAGKTTTARGLLRALGHQGKVKSPTYTLVEPYENLQPVVFHFDLYRLGDPEELEFMGFRDFLQQQALCLVEWPEKGQGWLGTADFELLLEAATAGRRLCFRAGSPRGERMRLCLERRLGALPDIEPLQASGQGVGSSGRADDVL